MILVWISKYLTSHRDQLGQKIVFSIFGVVAVKETDNSTVGLSNDTEWDSCHISVRESAEVMMEQLGSWL